MKKKGCKAKYYVARGAMYCPQCGWEMGVIYGQSGDAWNAGRKQDAVDEMYRTARTYTCGKCDTELDAELIQVIEYHVYDKQR